MGKSKTIHITIDGGATLSLLTLHEVNRLRMKLGKTSQTAVQADGLSGLKVVGEVHEYLERGSLKVIFEALVVEKLSVSVLGGMNTIYDNKIIPRAHEEIVEVNKHMFPQTNP